jgi:hypothetical protein
MTWLSYQAVHLLEEVSSKEAARVAQLVEHTLGKGEVIGSIPIASLQLTKSFEE